MESFTNDNYPHGIKILQGGKTLVIFSLPNQDDCKNFVQDIAESILEVKHMESLRIGTFSVKTINVHTIYYYKFAWSSSEDDHENPKIWPPVRG